MVNRLLLSTDSLDQRTVRLYRGIASETRITIRVTTTIISIKVKPRRDREARLPLGIRRPIGSFLLRLAVHVEDALSPPGEALGVILIAAHAPLRLAGERVHRNSP